MVVQPQSVPLRRSASFLNPFINENESMPLNGTDEIVSDAASGDRVASIPFRRGYGRIGPHMGSTQFLVSIRFLGVTFLTSSLSVFLMGLSPYGVCCCCRSGSGTPFRPVVLSSFDANLAHQHRNKNRRQSESGIRQALSNSSDGDSGSHQTQSDEGPGDRLKKGSEDRVQGIKKGPGEFREAPLVMWT